MTPPRSMSPTTTTGTSAARAKPILAMSCFPEIDLGRAAGALDEDDVRLALQLAEALQHRGHQALLQVLEGAGIGVAVDFALDDDLGADLALRLE